MDKATQMIELMRAIMRTCVKGTNNIVMAQGALRCVAEVIKYISVQDPSDPNGTKQRWVEDLVKDLPMDMLAVLLSEDVTKVLAEKEQN